MGLTELGIIVGVVYTVCLGIFSFNKYYLKPKRWKPKFHLNNRRLVCVNDGEKEIIIETITAKTNSNSFEAKRIRTRQNKELQKTNIIYPKQSCELEFDIDFEQFKSGIIEIEYTVSGKTKNETINITEKDTIHFINNMRVKYIPR